MLARLELEPTLTHHWLRTACRFPLFRGLEGTTVPCTSLSGTSVILICIFFPLFFFKIVGIITRHNLTHEFLQARLRQHYQTIWCPCPPPLSVWLPPSSKPAHALAFCLDPTRPKTCRLASHMHIKPGELENILLARELEEQPEPRAVDWSRALGLTTLDPGFFFSCAPVISFHQTSSWHCMFCYFVLFWVFFSGWKKEPSSSTVSCAENCSVFSLSSCMSPFSSSSLVPATVALFVWEGSRCQGWEEILQFSNSCSGGWLFSKAALKNPTLWK